MAQDYVAAGERAHYSGTLDCLTTIARTEGIAGLWSGAIARVISVAPLTAVTFGIYEKVKSMLASQREESAN